MASKTHSLVPILILLSFLKFATTTAQPPTYLYDICSQNKTAANSAFNTNLRTLLSSLSSSNATAKNDFYNTTVSSRNISESAYGMFMCRGDSNSCGQCVVNATQRLSSDSDCSLSKQGVIWFDECMVWFSNNRSILTTVFTRPGVFLSNTGNVSNQESFMRLLFRTMNDTADQAARDSPVLKKNYATKEATISGFQNLYCLTQCTENLSQQDCRSCLSDAIGLLPRCCGGKQGGRVLLPSCNVRYELYPFYRSSAASSPASVLVPERNYSGHVDSKDSEDPGYLTHNCSSRETFPVNSAFHSSLRNLLSNLSSKATSGKLFGMDEVEGTIYGLYQCRGDLPIQLCEQCVLNSTNRISSACAYSKVAIIWYSHCFLRYSYQNFFSQMATSPMFRDLNITSSFNPTQNQNLFHDTSVTLARVARETGDNDERYVIDSSQLNPSQTLYTLAQCTRDLSSNQCITCLNDVIALRIPWAVLGSVGGRVLYPSCNLRFELFQFYIGGEAPDPSLTNPSPSEPVEKSKSRSQTIILTVVAICISGILVLIAYFLLRRKARKTNKSTILKENFGDESAALEPLQFSLAVIKAASNNFSHENMIGRGGFGGVYKGILFDGRQIAVKRLSKNSNQGQNEFKNEVLLIAKLQHRNLVAFVGFCLEEQEKILVYEYVPNKSLDYFLFDVERQKLLNWVNRYNIIGGIARGILYLHEYSQLKVIHRDLKPSNILLDENMIPKISDFGLARIIEISQDQESTKKIVGTQ